MADVDHELGAIRFVVDAPLSSKVAMFNNVANQHQQSQYLNPFSNSDTRASPKRTFGKDEYGKPLAGSLTEMRGVKANIHVCKEMLQLCQIIDSEGFPLSKQEPNLKVILFGDLFNIYTLISDKVVGLLLRARKHKLIDFEGEVLFQRRDDDVPIYMLKSLDEIKRILEEKQDEARRSVSPAPQPRTAVADNLRRSVSPVPCQQNSSREATPAPLQNHKSRSVSPAPQLSNTGQMTESRRGSCGRPENHISRGASPSPQLTNAKPPANPEEKCIAANSTPQIQENMINAANEADKAGGATNSASVLQSSGVGSAPETSSKCAAGAVDDHPHKIPNGRTVADTTTTQ